MRPFGYGFSLPFVATPGQDSAIGEIYNKTMNKIDFEKAVQRTIFALLLKGNDLQGRLLEVLQEEFFENYTLEKDNQWKTLWAATSDFQNAHKRFPTKDELTSYAEDNEIEIKETINAAAQEDTSPWDDEKHYCRHRLERWLKHKMMRGLLSRLGVALGDDNFDDVPNLTAEIAAASMFSLSDGAWINPISEKGSEDVYEFMQPGTNKKVPCGIAEMDRLMDGGFGYSTLSGVLLGTHQGKTMFLCNCAANAIRSGKKVLYISMEEDRLTISSRILKNLTDSSMTEVRAMDKEDFKARLGKVVAGKDDNLRVLELPESGTTPDVLYGRVRSLEAREKFIPDIMFVDYVGKMSPSGKRTNAPLHERLAEVTVQVRDIGRVKMANHPPIVTAWQYNKEGSKNKSGSLTDIGGSYAQAHTADVMWAGEESEDDSTTLILRLVKARGCADGGLGKSVTLHKRTERQTLLEKEVWENMTESAKIKTHDSRDDIESDIKSDIYVDYE